MAKTMTPPQIDKAVGLFRTMLEKHAPEFPSDPVQRVLSDSGFVGETFANFRRRVEAITKTNRRQVKVDRTQTGAQAIDATGRTKWYIDEEVLAEMPLDGREDDTVEIFELDYDPTVDELDREYETRGLRPDPLAVAQAMTDHPIFADERPVAVQWRDKRNRACYAVFDRYGDEREVHVSWLDCRWSRFYQFAGVRK